MKIASPGYHPWSLRGPSWSLRGPMSQEYYFPRTNSRTIELKNRTATLNGYARAPRIDYQLTCASIFYCWHDTSHACFITQLLGAYFLSNSYIKRQKSILTAIKIPWCGKSCMLWSRIDGWQFWVVSNSVRVRLRSCIGLFECSHVVFASHYFLSSQNRVSWDENRLWKHTCCVFWKSTIVVLENSHIISRHYATTVWYSW